MSTTNNNGFSVINSAELQAALARKAAAEGKPAPSPLNMAQSNTAITALVQQPQTQGVPQGRQQPPTIPGQRFIAIVIDGAVVEALMATERLSAALQSSPTIVDVTTQPWLPEIGDFYDNGVFYFNPQAVLPQNGVQQ